MCVCVLARAQRESAAQLRSAEAESQGKLQSERAAKEHELKEASCSVLQCVAACCSVLQRVAACCSVLQCIAVCCSVRGRAAGDQRCKVSCVAVDCSEL